jgi:hypothetical protein
MVGAKLDLPITADSLESAPLLVPCVYRGVADTDPEKWNYYKVQIEKGQTLRVTARLRDSDLPASSSWRLAVRVHDGDGGLVGVVRTIREASGTSELEYKPAESGFAFVSVRWVVRDSAFRISIQ